MYIGLWSRNLNERDHSEHLGVDGKIILERILGCEGVNWVHMVHDRDQWRALVNTVMNLLIQ
jgi:hypothetical protein